MPRLLLVLLAYLGLACALEACAGQGPQCKADPADSRAEADEESDVGNLASHLLQVQRELQSGSGPGAKPGPAPKPGPAGPASAGPASAGIGPGGNPIPAMKTTNVTIDPVTLACTDATLKPSSDGLWTFQQIATAFLEYGVKKFYLESSSSDVMNYCTAALYIAAGSCKTMDSPQGHGCDATSTGTNGVFNLNWMLKNNAGTIVNPQVAKDGNIMNLCLSGFGAGYQSAAPYLSSAKTGVAFFEGDAVVTCMGAPSSLVGYPCQDAGATANAHDSNFIGPFCHRASLAHYGACTPNATSGVCCGGWTGGASGSVPFPDFYYSAGQTEINKGANFQAACQAAMHTAGF